MLSRNVGRFQSPEGDSLHCHQYPAQAFDLDEDGFQSPEGDSLHCHWVGQDGVPRASFGFNPPKGILFIVTR